MDIKLIDFTKLDLLFQAINKQIVKSGNHVFTD